MHYKYHYNALNIQASYRVFTVKSSPRSQIFGHKATHVLPASYPETLGKMLSMDAVGTITQHHPSAYTRLCCWEELKCAFRLKRLFCGRVIWPRVKIV